MVFSPLLEGVVSPRRHRCGRSLNFMTWMVVSVLAMLLASMTTTTTFAVATATAGQQQQQKLFRCSRPFSALDKFAASSMKVRDNCAFSYLTILNATATVACNTSSSSSSSGTTTAEPRDCFVTVSVAMLRPHGSEPLMDADEARFALELRLVNDSVIAYKGIEGKGFDVCCRLLDAPYAQCEWSDAHPLHNESAPVGHHDLLQERRRVLEVRHCALLGGSRGEGEEQGHQLTTLTGSVTKPLHRYQSGAWEARLLFFRRGPENTVGRVVIPFHVLPSQLSVSAGADASTPTETHPVGAGHGGLGAAVAMEHGDGEAHQQQPSVVGGDGGALVVPVAIDSEPSGADL